MVEFDLLIQIGAADTGGVADTGGAADTGGYADTGATNEWYGAALVFLYLGVSVFGPWFDAAFFCAAMDYRMQGQAPFRRCINWCEPQHIMVSPSSVGVNIKTPQKHYKVWFFLGVTTTCSVLLHIFLDNLWMSCGLRTGWQFINRVGAGTESFRKTPERMLRHLSPVFNLRTSADKEQRQNKIRAKPGGEST